METKMNFINGAVRRIVVAVIAVVALSFSASAQIQYVPTYNYRQGTETNQPRVQIVATTAYSVDYNGNYVKMPVRVQITDNGFGGVSMRVVEKYISTGFGGRWSKIYSGSDVRQCTPLASMNQLEKSFMFKATIDTNTWYFDLNF